ncbi:MAG: hypothetical protein D9N14_02290 [Ketobacter sp.]|nr:MAG: hypothetical protein D9N14_02290 [Ketobacter sp.]
MLFYVLPEGVEVAASLLRVTFTVTPNPIHVRCNQGREVSQVLPHAAVIIGGEDQLVLLGRRVLPDDPASKVYGLNQSNRGGNSFRFPIHDGVQNFLQLLFVCQHTILCAPPFYGGDDSKLIHTTQKT